MKKLKRTIHFSTHNYFQHILIVMFFMSSLFSFAQERQITGIVTDVDGEVIIGASVLVKGTTIGTITDLDGKFTLSVTDKSSMLEVSFVGYDPMVIPIKYEPMRIALNESSFLLDEVVAIGYGVAKKGSITGAIAQVSSDKLGERPISDVASVLQGQMAGVEVRSITGEPGQDIQIRVRGAASVNADANPLYVLDGVPVDNLTGVNPSDIESIEVLKDASSSAIYGSRGANGVVLVTTKRGKDGATRVQFNANWALQALESKMDLLSGEEWIDFAAHWRDQKYVADYAGKGASINDSWDVREKIIGGVNYDYMPDTRWTQPGYGGLTLIDWQDEFYRVAPMQNYELAVSGGTKSTNYRVSAGYLSQDGIAMETNYQRLNLRATLQSKLMDRITVSMNIAPTYSWSDGGRVNGKGSQSHTVLQCVPVAEPDAGILTGAEPFDRYMWAKPNDDTSNLSPVAFMKRSTNHSEFLRLTSSLNVKVDIIEGLSAEVMGAWNHFSFRNNYYTPSGVTSNWHLGEGVKSTGSKTERHRNKILFQALAHYNKDFGNHSLGAMLGYSMEQTTGGSDEMRATQFPNDVLTVFDLSYVTLNRANFNIFTPDRLLSYFGRLQYDYASRYLLTLSLRRDGSSKFGRNEQWGWFPAASGAWMISNEAFWPENALVNSFKIRASWGANGNNSIPANAALGILSNANYSYNGNVVSGFAPTSNVNDNLGWERTESWNAAVDLGLFNNRVFLSADYYVKRTKDLLYQVAVPAALGYSSSWENIGEIKNNGLEVELTTKNLTKQFKWETSFNMGWNKNEIVSLGAENETVYTGFSGTQVLQVGQPLRSFYMYKAVGVYQTKEDLEKYPTMTSSKVGDVRYADVTGDGKITEADRTLVGNPSPKLTFGLTNRFNYKNFDLSILLTGQTGGKIYGLWGRAIDRPGMGAQQNASGKWRNMWRSEEEPGDGKTPGILSTTSSLYDTRWLYSSDFIKIKNITLGYNIPWKHKHIDFARVFVSCENVHMWKSYDGYSPESNNGGTGGDYDYGAYPQARVFSLGINFTFK